MPWLLFIRNYNFRPPERPSCHIAYKAGMIEFVRGICAMNAILKGVARPATKEEIDERRRTS